MASLLHVCAPAAERRLLAELAAVYPASAHRLAGAGLAWTEVSPSESRVVPALAFARQVLPDPEPIAAASISRWSDAATARLIATLDASSPPAPWRLHVFSAAPPGARTGAGRAKLVREAIVAALKQRRRSLLRALVADDSAPWAEGERLAQLVLVAHDSGWLSVCGPEQRVQLRRCLSRFAGGDVAAPEDRRPPSRAYRKLLEAELRSGMAIAADERCVDLGASPGSWSWVALQRGAHVLAVDRAPLRDDLMRHPRLRFVQGNAFTFAPDAPDAPVDWLLCDVIAFPARTLELLERWTTRGWCRRFVVTVKFKGEGDDPLLQPLKVALERAGCEFALCQLGANKNEVTAWGTVPEAAASAASTAVAPPAAS